MNMEMKVCSSGCCRRYSSFSIRIRAYCKAIVVVVVVVVVVAVLVVVVVAVVVVLVVVVVVVVAMAALSPVVAGRACNYLGYHRVLTRLPRLTTRITRVAFPPGRSRQR